LLKKYKKWGVGRTVPKGCVELYVRFAICLHGMHRDHLPTDSRDIQLVSVAVVTVLWWHRKYSVANSCRRQLWQAAGVPGAVSRVDADSQFDKYVDRSTPCEPICCVNSSSSVWSLVLRSSVNWLTIALQISSFTTLISSPGTLYSILSGCNSNRFPWPFIAPSEYSGILLYLTTRVILYSWCFAWQVARRSPLFHFDASRGPCFVEFSVLQLVLGF
jgi:hypothetical protein